ncbi:MAG: hypothetical protein OHK0050_18620 [Roseiflexaceae bacterium]
MTILGSGVDVGVLPIIGQSGRLDWGVLPYPANQNGGIVGTVVYDTTRNELDPMRAAVETWSPGIPGVRVNLYAPVKNSTGGLAVDPLTGAYLKGPLLNSQITESWDRPIDCQARDVDGNPVTQSVLPPSTGGYDCLEGPLMGVQFQSDFAALDGNYGFTEILTSTTGVALAQPQPIPAGDYLVEVEIPNDAYGRPLYQVTREEDINVFGGDSYRPQLAAEAVTLNNVPICAGALHTVDVAGVGSDGPNAVVNPSFADAGGSIYEGQQRRLCDTKLVTLRNGRSIAPTFNFFTPVPIPGKFFGYIIDDLNISTNPRDLLFGEKAGVPNSPIGIYDYQNRLVTTIQSDPNGVFEALLPSTNTINCPSPSGVCPNLYRLVGNDPGVPGRLNPNYNPQFRTIAATFEVYPGTIEPADLAPTQIGVSIQAPGSQFNAMAQCAVDAASPQIFAVDRPVLNGSGTLTITGLGFGTTRGAVSLGGNDLAVSSWSDRQIVATVPSGLSAGPKQLNILASNGRETTIGMTIHLRGTGYTPTVFEVGPGRTYASIQSAIDAAQTAARALIVVYPGGLPDPSNPTYNPEGAYFENLIIDRPIKIQGVGPGGTYPDGMVVPGSIIDGRAFGGDTANATEWRQRIAAIQANNPWSGSQNIAEGEVIYILGRGNEFGGAYRAAIDGLRIQGGDQQGFPNNITVIGGTPTGLAPQTETQGGGIFVNGYARYLQITNNLFQSNGGAYGGAIRLGTPALPNSLDSQNDFIRIANNRMIANGGTNLAGAVAIFSGSEGYEIAENDICGNFSAEYGGAISHYGLSPNGSIHHNRIYFNRSYDEGGAVMIAGELPTDPGILSRGSGAVDVYNNLIQANLSNDDGGGLRFLMAGNFPINVYNNVIVNNIATHDGAGIALDDATNVRIYNNTIAKNITTATAVTSNGQAAPTGLSTVQNSALLQATLPANSPIFSRPLLFNNIFWDNRAGSWNGGTVNGIGLAGDPNPINRWDVGTSDGSGQLVVTNSMLDVQAGALPSASNRIGANPQLLQPIDVSVAVFPWRTNPNMVGSTLVAVDLPVEVLSDYHTGSSSPAINLGAAAQSGTNAPGTDLDDGPRPVLGGFDSGADEQAVVSTRVLDTFNRANGGVGTNWRGNTNGTNFFRIQNNEVQVRNVDGFLYWNPQSFGARQEAFVTFSRNSPAAFFQSLLLKINGANNNTFPTATARMIAVNYVPSTNRVVIETLAPGQGWRNRATFTGITFANGDVMSARALPDGTVQVYRNGTLIGQTNVTAGVNGWPAAYAAEGGRQGIWYSGPNFLGANEARFDNFGGGTLP